eukprot:s524_g20.t1
MIKYCHSEAARIKEPDPIGGDEQVHGHDDAASSRDHSLIDHHREEEKSFDDFKTDSGLQTLPQSPVPGPKRDWKWRSPAKRQALGIASSASSSSAYPTAEPIEESAIVAMESEPVSIPESELANPVPLQPAAPDLEPPAEVAAAAAGVDLVVAKAKAAPKAAAERPGPRHTRDYMNQWTDVPCRQCNVAIAGQIKFDQGPGGRDKPTWFMRVREDDGSLNQSSGRYFSRRLTSVVGNTDAFAISWIDEYKKCCGSKRLRPCP